MPIGKTDSTRGECQGSCRLKYHAVRASNCTSCSLLLSALGVSATCRGGLSQTTLGRFQFRVAPVHRRGFRALAAA